MAAKFKFKLQGLLKLREFNEKKLKLELAAIVKEISATKKRIEELKEEIKETYLSQEMVANEGAKAQLMSFYPYYIQAKRDDIKNQENLIYALEKKYKNKLNEVGKAMGEVKVIEGLKEKDFEKYKKDLLKQEEINNEENFQIRQYLNSGPKN